MPGKPTRSGQLFGPGAKARLARHAEATAYVALLLGAGALVAWLAVALRQQLFPNLPLLAYGIGSALGLLLVCTGWSSIRARFQSSVEVTPTNVRFGRGWSGESFACDEVEIIRLATVTGPARAPYIEIQARGKRRTFFLDGQEELCGEALHRLCSHAVYIDRQGGSHMPTGGERPLAALGNLAREGQRRGWISLAASLAVLLATIPSVIYLVQHAAGHAHWPRVELAILLPLALLCGLMMFAVAAARIHKGRRLGAHIRALAAAEAAPGTNPE